ncbi:MAG: cytochrome c maturation protein CcmE [Acidobacteriota bacterium]
MNKNVKFGLLIATILGALGYLAAGGVTQTATYYKEISELKHMGSDEASKRLRVAGDIMPHSIVRDGNKVHFTLIQNDLKLNVIYNGSDPLPDTFKDGSQALADGKMDPSGVFYANKVQAKCASKYEAKPGEAAARKV